MGDVRAERVEDELAGLRGDRDVGEIYEKTEIVVGHPHLGAEFCRVWSRFHEGENSSIGAHRRGNICGSIHS